MMQQNESLGARGALVFQASKYMMAAWKVTGEPKEKPVHVVEDAKLDYELFDRWSEFLAKPPQVTTSI